MRINYNVSAAIANKRLLGIESNLSTSMERLSSGLKINHSKDNPAGMAISNKMQAQIDGLDRASENASDGISVIQISDGALNEVTSILQRMRELSVQAASDATMSVEDKQAIQAEIDSLQEEIDRISTDTEYNTKTLLDGSLDTRVYTEHATRVQISDQIPAGEYGVTIDSAATQAQVEVNGIDFNSDVAIGQEGTIRINGCEVDIEATDTCAEAYEKIRNAAELGDVTALRDETSGAVTFVSDIYGKNSIIEITVDDEDLANALGFVAADGNALIEDADNECWVYGQMDGTNIIHPSGEDMTYSNLEGFSSSATVSVDGNRMNITDIGGVSLSFLVEEEYDGELDFEVTNIGTMTLHVGANESQNMEVRIPEVSTESMYIDDLNVVSKQGADRSITQCDNAIAYVSSVRARLGAYENRLEYSVNSLNAFEENMTGALSRLTDVDMAEEMTNYTHQNVLNQAAISVLTQANDIPQQILQILQ